MRKEAKLEQWYDLYEVAISIKALKPWKYLWDMDLITILLPEYEEPFFCSIMGRKGECIALGIYSGYDAINDFFKVIDKDIPFEQILRYQNNMMCYFGNRNELSKKELKIIKDLGIKFRGKNEWIYFHSFKTGYTPFILDENEIILLTQVLQQLFMALRAFIEKRIEVDFEKGKTLFRRYDEEKNLWFTFEAPLLIPSRKYMVTVLQDDILIAKLKRQQITKNEIEVDIFYLNAVIEDKKYERPILPKILIMADRKSGLLLDQEILSPEIDVVQEIFGSVIQYIMEVGKPKKILVRDEIIYGFLSDLCERTGIALEIKGRLRTIDNFVKEIAESGY